MRINKSVFKYIEHELYSYRQTKLELEQYKEEILEGAHFPEVNVKTGPGDQVLNKVLRLTSSAYVVHAERIINGIENGLTKLEERHRELYRLKYDSGLPWQEVALEMGISDRTYFRIRREVVTVIGQELGLLNIK